MHVYMDVSMKFLTKLIHLYIVISTHFIHRFFSPFFNVNFTLIHFIFDLNSLLLYFIVSHVSCFLQLYSRQETLNGRVKKYIANWIKCRKGLTRGQTEEIF